jgi:hypothetical protein
MKNILIISPEFWNGHSVSKHHYAKELAKAGNSVYFLNPPTQTKNIVITKSEYENLYSINYSALKGVRLLPKFLRVAYLNSFLKNFENKIGKKLDIIWLFENSRFYDLEFAQNRLKIYHQVDLNQNFNVKEAASSADICFCTTEFIRKELKKYNYRVYKINHGFNDKKLNLNEKLKNKIDKTKINVGYVGNLDIKYLDINLIEKLVSKFSEINFNFVGGYLEQNEFYKRLSKYKNAIFIGKIKSEYIVSFLEEMDINILAYQADIYKEQLANPHKVMEYLASGKVVVATYTDEYKYHMNLIEMVMQNSKFIDKFLEVVNNLSYYNSLEKIKLRKEFALKNSYKNQIKKIDIYLKENNLGGLL